jgi:hypothetical protein
MAEKVAKLKAENTKLKEEIRRLQRALKDISRDRSISSSPVDTYKPKYSHSPPHTRHVLRDQIAQKLEQGIFSPPKCSRGLSKSNRSKSKEKSMNLVISRESTQPIEFVPSFGEVKDTMSPLATHILSDTQSPKQLASLNEGVISRASLQDPEFEFLQPKESNSKRNSKRTLHDEIEELKLSMARINAVLEQKESVLLQPAKKDISCSFVKNTFDYEKENSSPKNFDQTLKDSFGSLYEDIKVTSREPKIAKQISTNYEPILRHESPRTQLQPVSGSCDNILMHDTPRHLLGNEISGTLESFKIETGSREHSLIREIDALREENKLLRGKFQPSTPSRRKRGRKRTVSSKKLMLKSPTRLSKSPTRLSKSPTRLSKSPSANSTLARKKSRSITPNRYRHCCTCDHLLSKGYSTKYCTKHGC